MISTLNILVHCLNSMEISINYVIAAQTIQHSWILVSVCFECNNHSSRLHSINVNRRQHQIRLHYHTVIPIVQAILLICSRLNCHPIALLSLSLFALHVTEKRTKTRIEYIWWVELKADKKRWRETEKIQFSEQSYNYMKLPRFYFMCLCW